MMVTYVDGFDIDGASASAYAAVDDATARVVTSL